jgi:hypothetical protein
MPSVILATRRTKMNTKDIIAVPLAAVAIKGEQTDLGGTHAEPEETSAVPPAGGATNVIREGHGTESVVSCEAD